MGELTRFRILRNPERSCPNEPRAFTTVHEGKSPFLISIQATIDAANGNLSEALPALKALLQREAEAGGFLAPKGATALRSLSNLLDEIWTFLRCNNEKSFEEFSGWLTQRLDFKVRDKASGADALARIANNTSWHELCGLLRDRILFLVATASVAAYDGGRVISPEFETMLDQAAARLRLAALINWVTEDKHDFTSQLLSRALETPLVLSSPPFPLLPTPILASPPVVADLFVVRDEWAKYEADDFAFVENVMPGEERERSTRRLNRTIVVQENETIDTSRARQETFESERTTESAEASKQTTLEVGIQFENDLTLRFGPIENHLKVGASLEFSRAESERRATEIAREAGRRSIEETERQIRQLRRETSETAIRELDAHRLSNSTDNAVRGVYRWIKKIQRYQLFRYPHRLQLEFYLPEPGRFLAQLLTQRAEEGGVVAVPDEIFLTIDGSKTGTPITLKDITAQNYLDLGQTFDVSDLPPPPDDSLVITESLSLKGSDRKVEASSWDLLPFAPVNAATKDIQVPDGFQATKWSASAAAAPELAKWRDWTDYSEIEDGVGEKIGYHSIVAAVTLGSSNVLIRNVATKGEPGKPAVEDINTVHVGPADYRDRWLARNAQWVENGAVTTQSTLTKPLVGKLSFGATLGGAYAGTVSVTLECVPTSEAVLSWKAAIVGALSRAVEARELARAAAERANRSDAADTVQRSISPSVGKQLMRNEIKRQVIECLLGDRFSGYDDAPDKADSNNVERPMHIFATAQKHGALVRFMEQSFEWDNLMSVLYPLYWAPSTRWSEAVEFERVDPEVKRFATCGGARVLVPARPGFESSIFSFLETGLIVSSVSLSGTSVGSLSVADEIMALTRPPEDGEPGKSWTSEVPTALLWLDTEITLPVGHPNPSLPAS